MRWYIKVFIRKVILILIAYDIYVKVKYVTLPE